MKTQEHTAGPWISTVIHPQYILNSKQQAFLVVSRDNGPAIDDATFTANCKLIAAAPQLLEALEALLALSAMGELPAKVTHNRYLELVAKAKGETL